ncbi:hypothetical protein [Lentilactobacillus kosonis]|uniref:hypothetical protein n=1 Tax=Lentilactobacillus kosonis TaxID=2810561 RepID=UPI00135CEBEF|nr:hypothetical protein [Lentilactobacillus kosonis]
MLKFYFYLVVTIILLLLAISSFISHSYWQGAGELLVSVIGMFLTFGTYHDQKS